MKYTNKANLAGLGVTERARLSQLIRRTQTTISVKEAAKILKLTTEQAAKQLAVLAKKGWLSRIKQGVYLPIDIPATNTNVIAEEPFTIAQKLFQPCYIGGMNAANYWDLTEQIFKSVTVMTQKKVRERNPIIAGNEYYIHSIKAEYFFGLKTIWNNNIKVQISDPTRTVVDMLIFPQFCGGVRFIVDVINDYYQSKYKDIDLLVEYLTKANNGAAIKRMGFLAEKFFPDENKLIEYCLKNLKQGYVKLSPSVDCPKIIRRWRLRLPESWSKKTK